VCVCVREPVCVCVCVMIESMLRQMFCKAAGDSLKRSKVCVKLFSHSLLGRTGQNVKGMFLSNFKLVSICLCLHTPPHTTTPPPHTTTTPPHPTTTPPHSTTHLHTPLHPLHTPLHTSTHHYTT